MRRERAAQQAVLKDRPVWLAADSELYPVPGLDRVSPRRTLRSPQRVRPA